MNYDLTTSEGMANAVTWTNNCLNMIASGGAWYVPRSGTKVTVISHNPKQCMVQSFLPDPSIKQVLQAAGWEIK